MTCDTAGADDTSFQITGNKLIFKPVADFETKNSYALCIRATDAGGLTKDKNFTINVKDINEAPTISGTPESTVNAGVAYSFTPTATDPDTTAPNNTLTFEIENKPSWLNFDSSNGTLSGTPSHSDVGTYNNIKLRAKDGGTPALSAELPEFNIIVNSVNRAPVITSTPVLTAIKGEQYSYTITATDEDNDPLIYSATIKPDWLTFDTDTHVLSGTPGNSEAGQTYQITLTVSDGTATTTQTFNLTVNDKNYTPTINDQTFSVAENTANNTEVGQIVATDPDAGQTLTYEIISGNDLGIFTLANDGKLTVANNTNLDYEQHQSITLRVKVTDNGTPALHTEADITINITDVNEAPVWTSVDTITMNEKETLEHTLTATDEDGDSLTYSVDNLPNWITLSNDKLTLTPQKTEIGIHTITTKVSDGFTTIARTLTITVNNINDAPIITSVAPTNAIKNQLYSYTIIATDEDNDPLTYSATIKPDWLSFDTNSHILSGTPGNAEVNQDYIVTLTVSDGTATATQTFTIHVNDKNYAPIISDQTFSIAENTANNTEVGQIVATDPDENQTLTYEILSGNDLGIFELTTEGKLKIQNNTNLDYEKYQSVILRIKVTDSSSPALSAEANVTINITDINEAPVWTSADQITIDEDSTIEHNLTATDPENATLIYSVDGSLPNWITLLNDKLTLQPTQSEVGSHNLLLKVSDGTNETPQTLQITVNNINDAPIITSIAPTNAIKNQLYSYTIIATDEDNDPLTYSATIKPDWLSFDTNSHILSGTPGNAEVNQDYIVTLTVSDGTATATQTFTIHVNNENHAPTILNQSFSVIENTVNGTEIAQVIANDPDSGQTLTYQILSGNDLNIFEITPDGKLKVKNNTNLDYEKYQSVILRVKVTDNGSPTLSAEANITINITDIDDEAPTITVNTTPIILTVGDSFSVPTATCHDNQSNCTLTINNQVNTAVAGNYQIIYTATDEAGNQAIAVISVIVKNPHTPYPPSPKPPKPPLPINPSTPLPPFNILTPTDPNNPIANTLPDANHNEESNPNHANDVFILKGEPEITLTVGESYSEPGIICLSDAGCSIKITGHVDTNTPGVYILTYHGTTHDENPKSAVLTRKITVKPATSSTTHPWNNFNQY